MLHLSNWLFWVFTCLRHTHFYWINNLIDPNASLWASFPPSISTYLTNFYSEHSKTEHYYCLSSSVLHPFLQRPPSLVRSLLLTLRASLPIASRGLCEFSMCYSGLSPSVSWAHASSSSPRLSKDLFYFFILDETGVSSSFPPFISQILCWTSRMC